MRVIEFKLKVNPSQKIAIQEAIRIGQFIRNKCLRFWMDATKEDKINYANLCKLTTELANSSEFSFVGKLNSMARQASAERAWFSISLKALIQSNDLVVYEDLKVSNMVKNPKLAKSIQDASWSMFTDWLDYFGKIHGKFVVAVNPQYTSQQCSSCGNIVKKTLSLRTHICSCGSVLDRDENAAINILARANTVGRTEIQALGQADPLSIK